MKKVPRITNDLDDVLKTLKFKKLSLIRSVALVEEITQLREQLRNAEETFEQMVPAEDSGRLIACVGALISNAQAMGFSERSPMAGAVLDAKALLLELMPPPVPL